MKTNGDDSIYNSRIWNTDGSPSENTTLTKREYFAAMALQGLCAHYGMHAKSVQNEATAAADALIEALNKEKAE